MQQTLLAALLVSAGATVSIDALMEELWGTTPPKKAENALQAQVSRLRRTLAKLEPERSGSRLITNGHGYGFRMERCELDACTFLDQVGAVQSRSTKPATKDIFARIVQLRSALGLWRGPVFGGLTGGPLCRTAAAKYRESRNAAMGLLHESELLVGGHARILPELIELYEQNPLHEEFCRLLMVALYRAGRQADALEAYRKFRDRLVGDLGIEPSPVLRQYERAILVHDTV